MCPLLARKQDACARLHAHARACRRTHARTLVHARMPRAHVHARVRARSLHSGRHAVHNLALAPHVHVRAAHPQALACGTCTDSCVYAYRRAHSRCLQAIHLRPLGGGCGFTAGTSAGLSARRRWRRQIHTTDAGPQSSIDLMVCVAARPVLRRGRRSTPRSGGPESRHARRRTARWRTVSVRGRTMVPRWRLSHWAHT